MISEEKVGSSTKLIGALDAAKNIDNFFVIALHLGSSLQLGPLKKSSDLWLITFH